MANEKRLIDVDKAKRDFNLYFGGVSHAVIANKILDEQPTVDAVEVVHGYWIDSTNVDHMGRIIEHGIDCSVCESVFKDDSREVVKRWKERFKVCPFCAAIMDGGNEDV